MSGSEMPVPEEAEAAKRPGKLRRFVQRIGRAAPFAAGVLAALVGLILYGALFPGPHAMTRAEVGQEVAQVLSSATPPPAFSETAYRIIQPSVVLIKSHNGQEESLGSGVVIRDQGAILTALHVVANAGEIEVTFADGTVSKATVTTAQPANDIAVLQPETLPSQVVAAVIGNPGALRVGDQVFAVGNPFGLYSSMSAGVVSGFNRSFQPPGANNVLTGLIQIDAAVNPGNSGGPLLNRDGEVVGIVTGIANPTDQPFFVGIGFAVPITTAASAAGSPPD